MPEAEQYAIYTPDENLLDHETKDKLSSGDKHENNQNSEMHGGDVNDDKSQKKAPLVHDRDEELKTICTWIGIDSPEKYIQENV